MKILYGISGIGTGHSNRQTPIIEHYASHGATIAIFAYDESMRICKERFSRFPNVTMIPVDIPFFAGNASGLDWEATARINAGKDVITTNSLAMAEATNVVGNPDIVITDYEPVSAQYAYAWNAPLVTLDQQSKYLCGIFPEIEGQSFRDEIMRLSMFFPKAAARLACSFFDVPIGENPFGVRIVPPTLKDQITKLQRSPENSVLVYISSQREFVQNIDAVIEACASHDCRFDVFLPHPFSGQTPPNLRVYQTGRPQFIEALSRCKGIVSTAGHTLLSEAMYLGIPVYAVPLGVFEQHMNARAIAANGFGVAHPVIEGSALEEFIGRIPEFEYNIREDTSFLLRKPGQHVIIPILDAIAGGT